MRSRGSVSMNRALMAAGLVDRVQLSIFPMITGQTGAPPIFQDTADFGLGLIECRTFDGGIQELIFGPPCTSEVASSRVVCAGRPEGRHRVDARPGRTAKLPAHDPHRAGPTEAGADPASA